MRTVTPYVKNIHYILALIVFVGCGRDDGGRLEKYSIFHNDRVIAFGMFRSHLKLEGNAEWRGLKGLRLSAVKAGGDHNSTFKFEPDQSNGKLMTLRGDIMISSGHSRVQLNELRLIRHSGTKGLETTAVRHSGWIIDPGEIEKIVRKAQKSE